MAAPADRDSELEEDGITPRSGSRLYTTQAYWEGRFEREAHHEWLAAWADVKDLICRLIPALDARILLVGCGNSRLAADMADGGFSRLVSTDYSAVVIDRMSAAVGDRGGRITWEVQDMRKLTYENATFDVVFDKAAMDAQLADGGDAWDAPSHLMAVADAILGETVRVLRPGGLYLQLSFGQPHFRKPYLLQRDLWAGLDTHKVPVGLGYFLYAARTHAATARASTEDFH